ncbi:MAG: hypothetical protein ABI716_02295, partial [Candidatus Saccharibacteria bacterium]
ASESMAEVSPEEMQASMGEWIAWRDEVVKKVGFDFGLPLEAVGLVTSDGVGESYSHVSGYSTMETDSKEEVLDLLRNHPHLKQPGATIDVLQILPMPGV